MVNKCAGTNFQGKGRCKKLQYLGVKLLEHTMNIVERVLERRIQKLVNIDLMQFGFMPRSGTTDAFCVVQRIQDEYRDKKKKLYICLWILRRHLIEFHER